MSVHGNVMDKGGVVHEIFARYHVEVMTTCERKVVTDPPRSWTHIVASVVGFETAEPVTCIDCIGRKR